MYYVALFEFINDTSHSSSSHYEAPAGCWAMLVLRLNIKAKWKGQFFRGVKTTDLGKVNK